MRELAFVVVAAVVGQLPAQTCVHSWGTGPTTPPAAQGGSFRVLTGQYERSHIRVPEVVFQNVPTLIREMSVTREGGWTQWRFDELIVRMGQTTVTTLNGPFVQNITSPLQDVLHVSDHDWLMGIGPDWIPLGLQQPFLFVPGQGHLLIEIVMVGAVLVQNVGQSSQLAGSHSGERTVGSGATLPVAGNNSQRIRLRFCVDQPESMLLGSACGGATSQPPLLGLAGVPSLGGQTTFWLSNAPPGSVAFLAFGFENLPPFPLDLTPLGAPGCRQYFDIAFTTAIGTDPLGIAAHPLSIPANQTLVGLNVYGQYGTLVPGSNALGVLTSNYGRLLLGQ